MEVAVDRTQGREAHAVCGKQTGGLKLLTIVVALAALCLVGGCGQFDRPHSQAVYEATSCPKPNIAGFPTLDFPANAQCGYLSVLEDRAKPEGRRIRIFVTRAPAVSATPKPDPIVYLSGGPGGAGSFEVAFMVGHGINAERDVIFVDQRGTHHADPLLDARSSNSTSTTGSVFPSRRRRPPRSRRVGQGVPRPPGGHGRRPRGLQQHRERRRHRRAAGGARHRQLECLRCLLRIETRVDRAAQSPAGHPQRRPRFGIAAQQQHRRDMVVGTGQLVQGDLRRLCGTARLRRALTHTWRPTSRPR